METTTTTPTTMKYLGGIWWRIWCEGKMFFVHDIVLFVYSFMLSFFYSHCLLLIRLIVCFVVIIVKIRVFVLHFLLCDY